MSLFKMFFVLFVTSLVLSACANTVRGVGADVKQTGQAVEDVVQ